MIIKKENELTVHELTNSYVRKGQSVNIITWVLLGGEKFLPDKPVSVLEFEIASEKGITKASLISLAEFMDIPMKTMADLLNISYKTLSRKNKNEVMDVLVSSLSIEIAHTFSRGLAVFEDPDKLNRWLQKENQALGGKKPFDLLNTPTGIKMVNRVLNRLEEGVYT